jgi:hypothetical protein
MSHATTRTTLLALEGFVAFTALFGAVFVVPTLPLDWIRTGPLADFTIPAVALGVFVGGSAVVAFGLLTLDHRWSAVASMIAGALIIVFEFVEIAVVGLAVIQHGAENLVSWLQLVCIGLGVAGMTLGYHLWQSPAIPRAYTRHAH